MENLLKSKNINVTPFRLAVLAVFENAESAIDQRELENELGEHDRITLYRTLKKFIDSNLIHEIIMPGEEKKMALCPRDCVHVERGNSHQHLHFKCTACNAVLCVELDQYPELRIPGFTIESVDLQAKGICNSCQN
jgi:Fur family ferric uptake transcriptional regulator